mmetsp:Transcript_13099/g.37165  ORF Transcript_13099/g.37165 Transcript_13099/m.37165 type:complete len:146 (-) Transcript_13099:117-554(-)
MTETLRRGAPGMKSVHDMPVLQDGPPPGGFPGVRYGRRVPTSGPTGAALFAVGAVLMGYGFYKVGQANHHRRAVKAEKLATRRALVPLLQAEEDRRFVAGTMAALRREAEIMEGVPGWRVGQRVYSGRSGWVPPTKPEGSPAILS